MIKVYKKSCGLFPSTAMFFHKEYPDDTPPEEIVEEFENEMYSSHCKASDFIIVKELKIPKWEEIKARVAKWESDQDKAED